MIRANRVDRPGADALPQRLRALTGAWSGG
jgi:hypothetical protein